MSVGCKNGAHFWDYVEGRHKRSTLLHNFHYSSGACRVLRPQFCVAALELWDYYLEDPLSHGACYDLGKLSSQ